MKLPRYRARDGLEFNMTPMIDVTFQLIIFFLVSSHLAQQEIQAEVNLPTAAAGDERRDDEQRLTVNVTADGALHVAGRKFDLGELDARLSAAAERPAEVRIRGDRAVAFGRIKPILRACLTHDVRRTTLAVVRREP